MFKELEVFLSAHSFSVYIKHHKTFLSDVLRVTTISDFDLGLQEI